MYVRNEKNVDSHVTAHFRTHILKNYKNGILLLLIILSMVMTFTATLYT